MAQLLALEERMFLFGGRKRAMSTVMTLTGSKPSSLFITYRKVILQQDKHVKLSFRLSRRSLERSSHS